MRNNLISRSASAILTGCVLLLPVAVCSSVLLAQETPAPGQPQAIEQQASRPTLPEKWIGTFAGRVTTRPQQMLFDMKLTIAPTAKPDRFTFTVIYEGAFGKQERNYALDVVDAQAGRFVIDERNGIKLPATLAFDTLHSHFVVMGNRITTRYSLDTAGDISFELITYNDKQAGTTGGPPKAEATPADQIPEVTTLTPASIQSAILRRVKQ